MVAKWVGLRVHVLALCARKVSVWVKGGKAWSLRSDTLQWCLCVHLGFIVNGCGVLWFRRFVGQKVVCVMECGCVSFCGCKVALCVCVYVGWVLLAVQVWKYAGGERCVDLERQKRGQEINPKKVGKPK